MQRLRQRLHPRPLQRVARVVDRDLTAPEVAQGKAVASGLRAGPPAAHLAQVPVQPLVQASSASGMTGRGIVRAGGRINRLMAAR